MEAVTMFLATGNMSLTAASLNIPLITLKSWKKKDWWIDALAELKSENNLKLNSRLSDIVKKSIEAVDDRIENGDYVYDEKHGKIIRIPAKLKDLHRVSMDMIAKQQVIQDREDRPVLTEQSLEERLLKVAEALTGVKKPKKIEIVEGDFTVESNSSGSGRSGNIVPEEEL